MESIKIDVSAIAVPDLVDGIRRVRDELWAGVPTFGGNGTEARAARLTNVLNQIEEVMPSMLGAAHTNTIEDYAKIIAGEIAAGEDVIPTDDDNVNVSVGQTVHVRSIYTNVDYMVVKVIELADAVSDGPGTKSEPGFLGETKNGSKGWYQISDVIR